MLWMLWGCGGAPGDPQTEPAQDTQVVSEDPCEVLGLAKQEFQDAADSSALYATAADFTIPTADGDWSYKEAWTGCDNVLVIEDEPTQTQSADYSIWEKKKDIKAFFQLVPKNTQIVFISTLQNDEDRAARLADLAGLVEEVLVDKLEEGEDDWWRPRIVYSTERSKKIEGWFGEAMADPGWGIGIDRFQRHRYIGSYADPDRYNSGYGWFDPNMEMAANEARYYNFEFDRQAAMDAEGATEVPLFRGERVAGNLDVTVQLPDASELATYDTMTVDLYMGCEGEGEYGYCPAWDYMAYLYVCDMPLDGGNPYGSETCQPYVAEVMGLCASDGVVGKDSCREDAECQPAADTVGDSAGADTQGATDTSAPAEPTVTYSCEGYEASIAADTQVGSCFEPGGATVEASYTCNSEGTGYGDLACACDTEIGRWITTYHREGRWWYDVSPYLPLVAHGGEQTFRFDTTGPYELEGSLRFSDQGKDTRPDEVAYLHSGGTINESYNENHPPVTVDVPADATSVSLAVVVSGHGMADPGNCAEFCDIDHEFTIGGETFNFDSEEAGGARDCMEQVSDGTVPNQYGTWWYGRSNWCPGKEVKTEVVDITHLVTPGEPAEVAYQAWFEGADYTGSATIRMHSWMVFGR